MQAALHMQVAIDGGNAESGRADLGQAVEIFEFQWLTGRGQYLLDSGVLPGAPTPTRPRSRRWIDKPWLRLRREMVHGGVAGMFAA